MEKDPKITRTEEGERRGWQFHRKVSEWNFKTLLLLGILLILTTKIVYDFVGFRASLGEACGFLASLLSYLVYGFILAYVLNAYMGWLERVPLKKMKPTRGKRYLSIALAYATLVAFVLFLVFTIVPRLVESLTDFAKMIPGMFDTINGFYRDIVEGGRFNLSPAVQESIVSGIASLKETMMGLVSVDLIASIGTRIVTATGTGIFNVAMSLLVSVYMLLEKDDALRASKRIVHGLFKPERADRISETGRKVDLVFKQYFTGKLLQATVILVLSYIVLLIGSVKYAILFAVILGFTNLIPYIGPWIGAVPVVLISLVQDPWMGVRALICILVIQMIDNWFITPRIVGGQMGVSPLLVLIGLCIGGTLFGFVGMLIGDVLAAIVKVLFYDSFIANRLSRRVASGDLPAEYGTVVSEESGKVGVFSKLWTGIRNIFQRNKK